MIDIDKINLPNTVLVTGAKGFVGGYVTRYLHKFGIKVKAMVRPGTDITEFKEIGIETVEADLLDPQSLDRAVQGVEGVLHIAALFRRAGLSKTEFYNVNATGTKSLLDACVKANVPRFVHCSTIGVHSHIDQPPGDETTPYSPSDMYQESKVDGEKIALKYMRSGKISGIVIRPAMIYGPGDLRILKLFKTIAENRFLFIGPCTAYTHFIDVRDLARAFTLGLAHQDINGEVFIIAGQESFPLKEAVRRIAKIMGVRCPKLHIPIKPLQIAGMICENICRPFKIQPPIFRRRVDFFIKNRYFNTSKAERMLGFKSLLSFNQELEDIISWYHNNNFFHLSNYPFSITEFNPLGTAALPKHPLDPITINNLPVSSTDLSVCQIVRDLDGVIRQWNRGAEEIYGWHRWEAEGRIIHPLLNTEFSPSIQTIYSQLFSSGYWRGTLIHYTKAGKRVAMHCLWRCIVTDKESTPIIIETNSADETAIDKLMNCANLIMPT
jgi:PAS domain S-box-containing protein